MKYLIRPGIHLPSALIVMDAAELKDETIAKEERRCCPYEAANHAHAQRRKSGSAVSSSVARHVFQS
jgi:hypothetical protein